MTDDKLAQEIKALVARILKLPGEKVRLDANLFTELGVDSMIGVEIFAALDQRYDICVPEDKLKDINTLNDLIGLVASLKT